MAKKPLTERQQLALAKGRFVRAQNIYNARLEESQAFRAALGEKYTYASDLIFEIGKRSYDDIMTEGIRRERDGRMTRIKGIEAITVHTRSLLRAANPQRQKDKYIANYLKAMLSPHSPYNFTAEQIYYVQQLLEKTSINHFRAIVIKGYLPDFTDIYADTGRFEDEDDFIEAIEFALSFAPDDMPDAEIQGRFSKKQIQQYKQLARVIRGDIAHIRQSRARIVYQESELKPLIREQEKKLKAELRTQKKSPSKDNLLK